MGAQRQPRANPGSAPFAKRKRGPALLPGPVSPDCCRGPGRIFGMVSAAPRPAPARASELRSGRRGWPFSTRPEGSAAVTSLGGPLRLSGRDRKSEAMFGCCCSARSAPSFHPACAGLPAGQISRRSVPSFPDPAACAPIPANQGSAPFPYRPSASGHACAPPSASASAPEPICMDPSLALPPALACRFPCLPPATLACRSRLPRRTLLAQHRSLPGRSGLRRPSGSWQRLGGTSILRHSGASHPRAVPECGFPKAPAPFPARVSF